ncbi:MAG: hypothetical protein HY913_20210 [Desulfomonile tiedjei]|nr:hypothetical protein [Desulfomonile tiedjei]
MIEGDISDILFAIPLMISVPFLVNHYLKGLPFTKQFRRMVTWGGVIWLVFSFFNEAYVYLLLGLSPMDAYVHWTQATKAAVEISRGHWPFQEAWPLGNEAYLAYLAYLQLITGCSPTLPVVINGWAAFWGGLVLSRSFGSLLPYGRTQSFWLLFIIFFPSTVFWATSNLKEAFMYWGGCQVFSLVFPRRNSSELLNPGAIAGVVVMAVLRPHVCAVWLGSCASVSFFQRGQRVYAVILLMALPFVEAGLHKAVGVELSSPTSAIDRLARQQSAQLAGEAGSSKIEYGGEGAIFFVSGFTSIFFRPFPWEIRSFRILISSMETWTVTLLMIFGWLRMTPFERRLAIRTPAIQAAVLVCLVFSIFFTYLPNEGLMVRQRVQMIPALLVLSFFPLFLREILSHSIRNQGGQGPRSFAAKFGSAK